MSKFKNNKFKQYEFRVVEKPGDRGIVVGESKEGKLLVSWLDLEIVDKKSVKEVSEK